MSNNKTVQCNSCGVSLHVGDQYSEDGCLVCGGEIHTQAKIDRRAEFTELLSEIDAEKF